MRIRYLTIALLLVTACASSGTGSEGQGQAGAKALPMERQVLTVGSQPDRYDNAPGKAPTLGKYPLNTSVFDNLVRMNVDLQVEPMLAERWEVLPDTNTYRFHLRRGVKFHDGQELTSEDVKYTFDLYSAARPGDYQQLGPDSVRVVDPFTVDITPIVQNNRLVEQLVHPYFGINRKGSHSDPLRPVGSGPYRFVEYIQNDRFVVERFNDYWNPPEAAKAQRITFTFIDDPQTRILALRSGEVDLILDVPRDVAGEMEGTPELKVVRSKVGATNALNINVGGAEPYNLGRNPAIREAIAAAVDRTAVLSRVWGNNAEESTTWVPAAVLGTYGSMVEGVPHNPMRAVQVLDQAGWNPGPDGVRVKDGRRLSLVYVVGFPNSDHVPAPEFIQDQLKKVGIETQIELMADSGSISERSREGTYDIEQLLDNQNEANPCFLPDILNYSKTTQPLNKFRAPGGKTDEAIERCRTAVTIDEVRMHAAEAVHQLVDVERAIVPLVGVYRIWAMKEAVTGFVPHPSQTNQRWEHVYLADA